MLTTSAMGGRLGMGLGDYKEGICKEGADYFVSDLSSTGRRTGVYSARPCTFAVLEAFKEMQRQINRVIVAKHLPMAPLMVDGRIGDKTTYALGQTAKSLSGQIEPQSAIADALKRAQSAPKDQDTMRAVATVSQPITAYVKQGADQAGAPVTQPEPGIPREDVKTEVLPDGTVIQTPAKKKSRMGWALGALAVVTAAGLIGAGIYYQRQA